MKNDKTLVFDMDGTIANLYGVKNWLPLLENKNPLPYIVAQPLVNMAELATLLMAFKNQGWIIAVTSWLAKGSTKEYDKAVRIAKKEWLKRYSFPFDEVHFIKYGTTKAKCTRHHGGYQVLIDDNEKVRQGWHLGTTIDATKNIIEELKKFL